MLQVSKDDGGSSSRDINVCEWKQMPSLCAGRMQTWESRDTCAAACNECQCCCTIETKIASFI